MHRLSAVANCSVALYPSAVQALLLGGLTAALCGQVNIANGESNFESYPLLHMPSTSQAHPAIIKLSMNKPDSMNEPGLPSIAPASTKAIFATTDMRGRCHINPASRPPARR